MAGDDFIHAIASDATIYHEQANDIAISRQPACP
jgi:hypothetical protein